MEDARHFDPVAWINTPRWQASRPGALAHGGSAGALGAPPGRVALRARGGYQREGVGVRVCGLRAAGGRLQGGPVHEPVHPLLRGAHPCERGKHHGRGVGPGRCGGASGGRGRGGGVRGSSYGVRAHGGGGLRAFPHRGLRYRGAGSGARGAVGRHQRHRDPRGERDLPHRARPYRFARGYLGRHRPARRPAS